MLSQVCTLLLLLFVRQIYRQGILLFPFHHCMVDNPNLKADLLRGKLVPRGDEFWR